MHAGGGDDTIILGKGGSFVTAGGGDDTFYITSVGGLYDVNPAGLPEGNSAVFLEFKEISDLDGSTIAICSVKGNLTVQFLETRACFPLQGSLT